MSAAERRLRRMIASAIRRRAIDIEATAGNSYDLRRDKRVVDELIAVSAAVARFEYPEPRRRAKLPVAA